MHTNQKIAQLRAALLACGGDACLIASSDPHSSEYLPAHWAARSYFSGFTGSMGTLVVTAAQAALWVDGRYFIQAEQQLAGSEIQLQRIGLADVPTVAEFLAQQLPQNGALVLDGMVTPTALVQQLEAAIAPKGGRIVQRDLVADLWQNRPPLPASEAFLLDECYAGESAAQKLQRVRQALAQQGATAVLLGQLPSVAWLLNLRAADIECTPFALSYCFVTQQQAYLFINAARLAAPQKLQQQGVEILPYESLLHTLAQWQAPQTVLVDADGLNYAAYTALAQNKAFSLVQGQDPVLALKAIKNSTELACLRASHTKDGVAMVRFGIWLEQQLQSGAAVTEYDVEQILLTLRAQQPLNRGASFDTIAAYGANAAMMHYHAGKQTAATLQPHGLLLVDSGGQYLDGTTDITRTYALGPLTEQERDYYTYVLQSHIELARLQFLQGCTGGNLDAIARAPIWCHGLDYRCGTGHGVGFFGGVHEGPHSLRTTNQTVFAPGMVVTNEPGLYQQGLLGIRIENELVCTKGPTNEYGTFLQFEAITYCPIDLAPVRLEWLTPAQKQWLNAYHALVYKTLAPHLTQQEAAWLAAKTVAV